MSEQFILPSVVVGIDGSRTAVHAALWAIDEALSREIPLRLVAAAETIDARTDAEAAVRSATAAVAATGRPIRIETQVITGAPIPALLEASGAAAMICIGAVGRTHVENRVGSTTRALVASAHCPVAVVHGSAPTADDRPGWVVVELDETDDSSAVLQFGVEEARLRTAPLRVLGSWQPRYTDIHESRAVAEGNQMVRAQLDRRLSQWRHLYPDLDVRPVAIHGSALTYLAKHSAEIQLVLVGAPNTTGVDELLGPLGITALQDTDCTILVVDRQRLL